MRLNLTNLALVDYFVKGGPFMWVLLACSLAGLAILIYKLFALAISGRDEPELADQITALARQGETTRAMALCEGSRSATIAVLAQILRADGASLWELREEAQMAGARQIALLESGLSMLSVVANVSPLVGFLGTVSGMIRAFMATAEAGLGDPHVVASGIAEALITTAGGLIIAVPAYIAYSYFIDRVNGIGLNMELAATRLVNVMASGSRPRGHAEEGAEADAYPDAL